MPDTKIVATSSANVVRSEQFRSVYVNHATSGATNWDIHMTFGVLVEQTPSNPVVEEQVMLMMTYEFAKAVYETLGVTINAYENKATLLLPAQPPTQQSEVTPRG